MFEYICSGWQLKGKSASGRLDLWSDDGFTLIEILVAVTIMGLAYVAILQSFSVSARNIVKMEESRKSVLTYALEFEKKLLTLEKMDEGIASEGEALVEGAIYKISLITDEKDNFMTLKLEKK